LLVTAIILAEDSSYFIRQVCSTLLVGPRDSQILLDMARAGNDATRRKINTIFFSLGWAFADTLNAIFWGTQEGVLDRDLEAPLYIELGSELAQELRDDYRREDREKAERQNTIDNGLTALQRLMRRNESETTTTTTTKTKTL
jgi:hypothetical protein